MPFVICIGRDALLMAATSVISVIALETACNSAHLASIPSAFFYASALIVFLITLILYFAGQRCGGACCIAVVICCGFGIAEHFVIEFKGAALLPSDLLAMGTAMAVSEGYHFTFDTSIVASLTWAAVACAMLSLISPPRLSKRSHVIVNVGVNSSPGPASQVHLPMSNSRMRSTLAMTVGGPSAATRHMALSPSSPRPLRTSRSSNRTITPISKRRTSRRSLPPSTMPDAVRAPSVRPP